MRSKGGLKVVDSQACKDFLSIIRDILIHSEVKRVREEGRIIRKGKTHVQSFAKTKKSEAAVSSLGLPK